MSEADVQPAWASFLESTYRAAADLGGWDREALEFPMGEPRRPRPLNSESVSRAGKRKRHELAVLS
jgi:hypothetical protein